MYFKNIFLRNLSYPVLTLFILLFVIFYPSLSISKIFKIQDIQIEEPFNFDFDKEKVINKAFVIAFDELVSSLITSKDKNKNNYCWYIDYRSYCFVISCEPIWL